MSSEAVTPIAQEAPVPTPAASTSPPAQPAPPIQNMPPEPAAPTTPGLATWPFRAIYDAKAALERDVRHSAPRLSQHSKPPHPVLRCTFVASCRIPRGALIDTEQAAVWQRLLVFGSNGADNQFIPGRAESHRDWFFAEKENAPTGQKLLDLFLDWLRARCKEDAASMRAWLVARVTKKMEKNYAPGGSHANQPLRALADFVLAQRALPLTIAAAGSFPYGIGYFERLSELNHSCAPNAAIAGNRDTLVLYALRDIASGEEITICYDWRVQVLGLEDRRALLLEEHLVTCLCARCIKESDGDARDGISTAPVDSLPVENTAARELWDATITWANDIMGTAAPAATPAPAGNDMDNAAAAPVPMPADGASGTNVEKAAAAAPAPAPAGGSDSADEKQQRDTVDPDRQVQRFEKSILFFAEKRDKRAPWDAMPDVLIVLAMHALQRLLVSVPPALVSADRGDGIRWNVVWALAQGLVERAAKIKSCWFPGLPVMHMIHRALKLRRDGRIINPSLFGSVAARHTRVPPLARYFAQQYLSYFANEAATPLMCEVDRTIEFLSHHDAHRERQ